MPRPLKDFTVSSKREYSEVARSYRFLIREMGLKIPVDDPFKYIPKMASRLGLRFETEHWAIEILCLAKDLKGLSGKNPKGVAAAAIYLACIELKDNRVQRLVAEAAGTTVVTLRNRLRGLEILLARG